MVANLRGGGVRQGGSTITQQLAKTNFLSRRPDHQAQGAGGDHRLLARGLADQAGDPLALFVERLFRRRSLWACARPPTIISGAIPKISASPSRRCSPEWSRRPSRLAPTQQPRAAQKRSELVLQAMADTGVISRGARAIDGACAARRPGGQASDRLLFCRLGDALCAGRVRRPILAR